MGYKNPKRIFHPVSLDDREMLRKLAITAMRSKAVGSAREHLADVAIDAILQIIESRGGKSSADIDNIQIVKRAGGSLIETSLIRGIILDKEAVHAGMPKRVENAKIALLNCPLEVKKTEFSAEIRIKDPLQMRTFLEQESGILQNAVFKIASSGVNVVICQRGVDDIAQHFLYREGILAIKNASETDMEKLAKASNGRILTNFDDLKPADLGHAELVEERKIGDDKMVFY